MASFGPFVALAFATPAFASTGAANGYTEQTIKRDPALFWWILLPITLVMVITGVLRHYLMVLLQSPPKPLPLAKLKERQALLRGQNTRAHSYNLPASSFQARKAMLLNGYKEGLFLAEPDKRGEKAVAKNPLTDPSAMEGMMGAMKGNVAMMVSQTLIMNWINSFFAGFVLLKLPFPLTPQFKAMLQSGVGTRDLDVRWVSSLSWYFLTLFGLQPVYNFILGSSNANAMTSQMAQMQPNPAMMGGGMPGQDQDPDKQFLAEAENLEVLDHWCVLDGVEDRLLKRAYERATL